MMVVMVQKNKLWIKYGRKKKSSKRDVKWLLEERNLPTSIIFLFLCDDNPPAITHIQCRCLFIFKACLENCFVLFWCYNTCEGGLWISRMRLSYLFFKRILKTFLLNTRMNGWIHGWMKKEKDNFLPLLWLLVESHFTNNISPHICINIVVYFDENNFISNLFWIKCHSYKVEIY